VQIDDFLAARSGPGRPPRLSDAELICLAVCQMLLGLPNDRQFLALADKGFAGDEFETFMADLDANFVRPDRKDEPVRDRDTESTI
jgi:hypothetical protein